MNGVRSLSWEAATATWGEAWEAAVARDDDPGALFRSPQWFAAVDAWLERIGPRPEFWGWLDPSGANLLPLVRERAEFHGIPYRRLRLAVIPDTQFGDAPLSTTDLGPLLKALSADGGWDVLELHHVSADGVLARGLIPFLRHSGLALSALPDNGNPWIDLTLGWKAYYASRSRRLKKGNNHIRNRLQRHFQRIEVKRWHGGPGSEAVLALLVAVSSASWKKKTGLTLDNPAPRAWLEALFRQHAPRGELQVWWLELDGRAVATELQLCRAGHVYALRADYDQSFEDHSPGTYLFWRLLEALQEEGENRRYWMGPGHNPYKERWLQGVEPLWRYRFYRRNLRGRLLYALEGRLKPWLRKRTTGKEKMTK